MEDPPNFNKRTVLNKHTGWKNTKILINAQDEINARCNFCLYIQNFKNGTKWEKWIKLALKGGKFGKYWWKSPKYLRKNLINTRYRSNATEIKTNFLGTKGSSDYGK